MAKAGEWEVESRSFSQYCETASNEILKIMDKNRENIEKSMQESVRALSRNAIED